MGGYVLTERRPVEIVAVTQGSRDIPGFLPPEFVNYHLRQDTKLSYAASIAMGQFPACDKKGAMSSLRPERKSACLILNSEVER